MSTQKITKEEYLDRSFDYTKLTKQELRQILLENNVDDIPPLTSLKSTIQAAYKKQIHDKIDSIKSNFTKENIFQKEKVKKEENSNLSQISQEISHETPSFDASYHEASFNKSLMGENSSLGNKTIEESSEINSTAFSKTHKVPFIAIPRRKPEVVVTPPRRRFPIMKVILFLLALFCGYLKFYCPYCGVPGSLICIPVPNHARMVDGKLICDSGFRLSRGIVDVCVPTGKDEIHRKAKEFISMLEYLKGDFTFGHAKTPRISLSLITDDLVSKAVKSSPRVIVTQDWVEAKTARVSLRVFIKFYSVVLLKIFLTLILVVVAMKVYLSKRQKAALQRTNAMTISKEIIDILNRQIMMSVKSAQFRPYVLAEQVRDALEIKEDLWIYIQEIIQKNSNVEKTVDENGKIVWKWIGPVLYKAETTEIQ
ncbi:hypothetical protein GINT2_002254 [Glugoides intestinalis]